MDKILARLREKGWRCSTLIDIGCADGQLFLSLKLQGLLDNAVPLHLDANSLYEPSLRAIKEAVGGDYRITAISDQIGEVELIQSAHPYWSSLRGEGDPYWNRVNNLVLGKVTVPMTTLDAVVRELSVEPPFLLKLDVQGSEASVLAGASVTLASTDVVVCEADIADFEKIDSALVNAGFDLYDLTTLSRLQDGTLGWFYPVYIKRNHVEWKPSAFWQENQNPDVIRSQVERRETILKANAEMLNRLKYRDSKVGRNEPCPCGSGQRFKHCCGRHNA
jgi:FkbM family methyltransferase